MPEGLDEIETLKVDGIRYGFWDIDFLYPGDESYLKILQHHLNIEVY